MPGRPLSPPAPLATPLLARLAVLLAALLLGGAVLAGCWSTQRFPRPMGPPRRPSPAAAEAPAPGPEEVVVWRHGDPVRVQPAGSAASWPLSFHDKDVRLVAGSRVLTDAGGRAEVQWPHGSSIVLFHRGSGIVGSPTRGEPMFAFEDVTRAALDLEPGDRVRLLGGAILAAETGPFLLERREGGVLRLANQSKGVGRLEFREARIELDPGAVIDLPLLSAGGAPVQDDPGLATLAGEGFAVDVYGALERLPWEGGFRLRATGENEVRGLGVRVRLDPGETVVLEGLAGGAAPAAAPPPDPASAPEGAPEDRGEPR
jgi:hypothetical protein